MMNMVDKIRDDGTYSEEYWAGRPWKFWEENNFRFHINAVEQFTVLKFSVVIYSKLQL